jgi:hypothetical protein
VRTVLCVYSVICSAYMSCCHRLLDVCNSSSCRSLEAVVVQFHSGEYHACDAQRQLTVATLRQSHCSAVISNTVHALVHCEATDISY